MFSVFLKTPTGRLCVGVGVTVSVAEVGENAGVRDECATNATKEVAEGVRAKNDLRVAY